jgi:hypothetical protein
MGVHAEPNRATISTTCAALPRVNAGIATRQTTIERRGPHSRAFLAGRGGCGARLAVQFLQAVGTAASASHWSSGRRRGRSPGAPAAGISVAKVTGSAGDRRVSLSRRRCRRTRALAWCPRQRRDGHGTRDRRRPNWLRGGKYDARLRADLAVDAVHIGAPAENDRGHQRDAHQHRVDPRDPHRPRQPPKPMFVHRPDRAVDAKFMLLEGADRARHSAGAVTVKSDSAVVITQQRLELA